MKKTDLWIKMFNLTRGRFFSVTFRKKDGSLRTLNGQTGKIIDGKIRKNKYLVVTDVQNSAYRMVNLSTIKSFKCEELSL